MTCPSVSSSTAEPFIHLTFYGSWKYTRGLIMDGNFKAEHLRDHKADDQVWLMDGCGFMVTQGEYKGYLSATSNPLEVPSSSSDVSGSC